MNNLKNSQKHIYFLKYDFVIIFFLAFIFFSLNALFPFYTRGEAREGLVINAMFQQNNFILPLRNGVDIPSKPPLFHWIAALIIYLTERKDEYFYRIPAILSSAISLSFFVTFTKKYLDSSFCIFFALILGTSMEWLRSSSVARVDLLFACTLSSGLFLIFDFLNTYFKTNKICFSKLIILSIVLALSFLTKGPAGLVLPWAITALFLLITKKIDLRLVKMLFLSSAVTIIIAGVWYLLSYNIAHEKFLEVQLMKENIARVVGMEDYDTGHKGSFLSIILLLISGYFPWSLFFPITFYALFKERKKLLLEENYLALFSVIVTAFFIIFFGFVSSKRSVYLLPAYPALTYLFLWSLKNLNLEKYLRLKKLTNFLFMLIFVISFIISPLILSKKYIPFALSFLKEKDLYLLGEVINGISLNKTILLAILLIANFYILVQGLEKKGLFSHIKLALLQILILNIIIVSIILWPITKASSAKEFFTSIKTNHPEIQNIQQFNDDYYIAAFYFGKNIQRADSIEEIKENPGYIIFSKKDLELANLKFKNLSILQVSKNYAIYGKDKFILAKVEK